MKMSTRGHQVLIDREGCELTAYPDSVGVWTIGCGHTSAAGPPEVVPGMTITMKQAWVLFDDDTNMFEAVVNDAVPSNWRSTSSTLA
jgi:lysozyme